MAGQTAVHTGTRTVGAGEAARLLGVTPYRFGRLARAGCVRPVWWYVNRYQAVVWRYPEAELRELARSFPDGRPPARLPAGGDARARLWRAHRVERLLREAAGPWERAAVWWALLGGAAGPRVSGPVVGVADSRAPDSPPGAAEEAADPRVPGPPPRAAVACGACAPGPPGGAATGTRALGPHEAAHLARLAPVLGGHGPGWPPRPGTVTALCTAQGEEERAAARAALAAEVAWARLVCPPPVGGPPAAAGEEVAAGWAGAGGVRLLTGNAPPGSGHTTPESPARAPGRVGVDPPEFTPPAPEPGHSDPAPPLL
jgi:Family of unknown function (DUF6397)